MRKFLLTAAACLALVGCSDRKPAAFGASPEMPVVFPETSAQEIQALVKSNPEISESSETAVAASELQDIIDMGARLYKWLDLLNTKRPANQKISFSTRENIRSWPVDRPSVYNSQLIRAEHTSLMGKIPQAFRSVLISTGPLPETLPISDQEFLAWGVQVSWSYDSAARWVMMANYMMQLRSRQVEDVRGYLYFRSVQDPEALLVAFRQQDAATQEKIRISMFQICLNNQSWWGIDTKACRDAVASAEARDTLVALFRTYFPTAKAHYESFYQLEPSLMRQDITWTSADPVTLHYPFLKPPQANIASYLSDNIEDEFKKPGFQLRLDFSTVRKPGLSYLEYQTGVTPHAMKGKIVMDQNEPITEWSSQWTIRHEFGHLLGFKDCYVEFFDENLNAIVNYQLDTTDLMCSRRGVFQEHHYQTLKAAYYR